MQRSKKYANVLNKLINARLRLTFSHRQLRTNCLNTTINFAGKN